MRKKIDHVVGHPLRRQRAYCTWFTARSDRIGKSIFSLFRETEKLSERRARIESIQTYISYRIRHKVDRYRLDERTKTPPHQFIFFTCDFNLSPLHTHTWTRPSYTWGARKGGNLCQGNLVRVCFSETRVYFLRSPFPVQYDIRIKNYFKIRTGRWRVQKRPDRVSLYLVLRTFFYLVHPYLHRNVWIKRCKKFVFNFIHSILKYFIAHRK